MYLNAFDSQARRGPAGELAYSVPSGPLAGLRGGQEERKLDRKEGRSRK